MSARVVTLISPAPVDGYPPVQSQARLLADAGYDVRLLSTPLRSRDGVEFSHPGVRLTPIPLSDSRIARVVAYGRYIAAITGIRVADRGRIAGEIAYDPNGIFLSDLARGRRPPRIAHFHETLVHLHVAASHRRLHRAVPRYDLAVVADEGRAPVLMRELGLRVPPLVVPNYPLARAPSPPPPRSPGFEVVYGGSLGAQQQIELILRSVPLWPAQARLVLLGDDDKPGVRPFKALAAELGLGDRVDFAGWVGTDALIDRYRRAHLGISLLDPSFEQWRLSIGASNKRYQYMQAGLPQIGDRIAGVPELLEGAGIGRVIDAYTAESVAAAVRHYADRPEEAAAAGARAEALHRARYNYQSAFAPVLGWIGEPVRCG